ncbi:MAG: hypothetical protein JO203_06475 [Gammaproteobacteria bacterium]|nr:hypothetical protein [Gammaproteobacteria bacterium]
MATLLVAALSGASVARADQEIVETKDLRVVYYDPAETYLVPHVLQSLLSGLRAHEKLFDYTPDGPLNVWLKDFSDRANAHARAEPRNRLSFDIAATNDPYETLNFGDRFESLATHELTHIVTMDRAAPVDARFRRLFHSKVGLDPAHPETLLYYYLTVPRATAPRWFHEGSAVFMETWLSGGRGRAQGGYDEMVFRAMVKENARFYDPLALMSKGTEIDFQTGANDYLYGTRFMNYLAFKYGAKHLLDWWRRDAASRRYYADDFQRVFGLPLDKSWHQWIEFEHEFQQQNLQSVHEHPLTPYRDLTRKDLGAISRSFLSPDGTRLYAAVRYPGQLAHIVSIDLSNGAVTRLNEVRGAASYVVTSLAYDPGSQTLFYTTDNSNFRNLEALDLRSGKSRQLLKAARIGDIAFNSADRSLWGLRLDNGYVQLVRIPFPYRDWEKLYVFPPLVKAFDLDLSPDGTLASVSVSGAGLKSGSSQVTQVRVLRTDALMRGKAAPLHTFEMGAAVPESFVFSRDGRYLYGSSYYTGVSNVYRYEIATETLTAVTNAETGFFRPLPLDDSKLIVLRYGAKGFVPAEIEARPTEDLSAVNFLGEQVAEKYPEVQSWVAAPPSSMPYESQIQHEGPYRRMRELSLDSVIPVIEGYKDSVALGASARFSDPIGLDYLSVDTSYSPDDALPSKERLHVSTEAHHRDWTVGATWNAADFYDLFGPTKRSRAGYSAWIGYDYVLIVEPPKYADFVTKVAYYGDLDTLPGFQNVPSPSQQLFTAEAGFLAGDLRRSPGAVDDEAGYRWAVKGHAYGAAGDLIPSVAGTLDIGFPLPIDHSSIWLRTGAGISAAAHSSSLDPLANFYLGGFGNNYVDSPRYGSPQRYRELLSMPGFAIDALSGRSLVKGLLEWCLPPVRFESLGSPGFYVSWARPELFAGALETDLGTSGTRRNAQDVGVQIDFQLHVMHRLMMMLSFGAAQGYGGGGLGTTEFMASLQVL